MTDAILDQTGRKLVQLWLTRDQLIVIDRFRDREGDSPTRTEAIRRLIHLGLADDALYRGKR